MKTIFSSVQLWEFFVLMEVMGISKDNFDNHLNRLKEQFYYREDTINYTTHEGKEEIAIQKVISLDFSAGLNYSIILDYQLDYWGDQVNTCQFLYLYNQKTKTKELLGWMDMARWHPLFIAPEEFKLLLKYWFTIDKQWAGTIYPKLLFKGFVGWHNPTEFKNFQKEINQAFNQLLPNTPSELMEQLCHVPFYGELNYRWLNNEHLGWVYESEHYNCYTIRNECHSTSEDEVFPFKDWNLMIQDIENLLNEKCTIKTDPGNWTYESPLS